MGVAYKCAWCGKEYVEPLNYEGSIKGALDFIENRTKEITEQCCGIEKPISGRDEDDITD